MQEIKVERTHLFAPNISVIVKVEISGNPSDAEIRTAIKKPSRLSISFPHSKNGQTLWQNFPKRPFAFLMENLCGFSSFASRISWFCTSGKGTEGGMRLAKYFR